MTSTTQQQAAVGECREHFQARVPEAAPLRGRPARLNLGGDRDTQGYGVHEDVGRIG
jgi:hypothetical protein